MKAPAPRSLLSFAAAACAAWGLVWLAVGRVPPERVAEAAAGHLLGYRR